MGNTRQYFLTIARLVYPLVYPHGKNSWSNVGGLVLKWSSESQNILMKQSTKNTTRDHTHVIMDIWYG